MGSGAGTMSCYVNSCSVVDASYVNRSDSRHFWACSWTLVDFWCSHLGSNHEISELTQFMLIGA